MEDHYPSTMTLNAADVQRMITAAAHEAAQEVGKHNYLTKDDVEEMIEKGIDRFCKRIGIPTDEEKVEKWRDDMNKMRSSVAFQDELKSHGIKAAFGLIVIAILSALWVGIQSGLRK